MSISRCSSSFKLFSFGLFFSEIPTEPQTRLVKVEKLQSDEVEGVISRGNVLLAGRIPKGNTS